MNKITRSSSPGPALRTLTAALLAGSALAPAVLMSARPAFAACTIVGSGTIGGLGSNTTAACTGAGNTDAIGASSSSNVTVTIGDGTTMTTVQPTAGTDAVTFSQSPNAILTVTNNATLSSDGAFAVRLTGSDNATVTIAAGGLVAASNGIPAMRFEGMPGTPLAGLALSIDGIVQSDATGVLLLNAVGANVSVGGTGFVDAAFQGISLGNDVQGSTVTVASGALVQATGNGGEAVTLGGTSNRLTVGGAINANSTGGTGVVVGPGATGNTIDVLTTGHIGGTDHAVRLDGGGNTLSTAGSLTNASATLATVQGSSGGDLVINAGLIQNVGGGPAISLGGGADILELRAGYQFIGNVLGGGGENTLRFGGAADAGFDMATVGPGKQFQNFSIIEKTGSSTWVLTGNSATSAELLIQQGTVLVNGNLGSLSNVEVTGGVLGGSGTVGDTTIHAGGTLSPGNSIGTITVNGTLTFQPGSTYRVEVSPAAADRTDVTGTATLAGTVAASFSPGTYVTKRYTILNAAGGLSGRTFGGLITTGLPTGFMAALNYGANDVYLDLTGGLSQQPGTWLPINQANVAAAINGAFNAGAALPPGFVGLFGLGGDTLARALATLDGEAATGAQQAGFRLGNQFLALMLDPLSFGRSGAAWGGGAAAGAATAYAPPSPTVATADRAFAAALKAPPATPLAPAPAYTAWAGGFGGTSRAQGDPATLGSSDLSVRTAGYAAGVERRLAPGSAIGIALAGGATDWGLSGGLGGGKSDAFQAGVYGTTTLGAAYLAGAASYARHWMSTDRAVLGGSSVTAQFGATGFGGRFEAGWRTATPIGGVMPYGAVQVQSFHTPGYSEIDPSGSGFGLAVQARDATAARTELGLRLEHQVFLSDTAQVALQSRIAWAHDRTSDPTVAAAFQTLPSAAFVVGGAVPASDLALVSAGVQVRLAGGWSVLGRFDGEFADGARTLAGTGSLRYAW